MTAHYEITEALMRVERAAREHVHATYKQRITTFQLLRSALLDLDQLRERIAGAQKEASG